MNHNSSGPGPVPNRWLYCPRKSDTVISERFLAFKTPLSKAFNNQLPVKCLFPPEMIFGWCKAVKLNLGLWIDLTNTKRFYDQEVVEKNNARYVKLQCRGHGETPSKEQTQSFIEIVDSFIDERPFDIIGVHCTHGFNRTGFLIVSYLVERLDCSLEAALATFAQARPPGIYKQDYINELYQRYENGEQPIAAPELPNWCFDYDDSDGDKTNRAQKRSHDETQCGISGQNNEFLNNGEGLDEPDEDDQVGGDDDTNADADFKKPRKKRRREVVLKDATFMAGVPGVQAIYDQPRLETLQRKVQDMCGWEKSGFPGAQPVSMDCENLTNLQKMPYRVSWKADGTRYMLLINKKDEIFFFDRNYSCFQVEKITFLKAGKLNEHLEDTLVDGEMVIDRSNGISMPRYLIYDIIRIGNANIGKHPFPERLRCIEKEICAPRHAAMTSGIINRSSEPFGIRLKEFWEINQAASLLGEKFAKTLLHEPDGLIFQPANLPYTPGVCPYVLKWKPSELNSVDFRLKIVKLEGLGMLPRKACLLYVAGYDKPIDEIKYTNAIKDLDNKIIECTVNQNRKWEFLRERTDKTLPNSYKTTVSVMKSILHPVTKEILLDFISKHGFREKMMPPPASHHVYRNHNSQNQQQQHQSHSRQF